MGFKGLIGEFKVAYYKSSQPNIVYSKFFDKFEDALSYSKTLSTPFLIFREHLIKGAEYSWELMPYGAYKEYKIGAQIVSYKWFFVFALVLILIVTLKVKFNG